MNSYSRRDKQPKEDIDFMVLLPFLIAAVVMSFVCLIFLAFLYRFLPIGTGALPTIALLISLGSVFACSFLDRKSVV